MWTKPDGGDEITRYTVSASVNDGVVSSKSVSHEQNNDSLQYGVILQNLSPGVDYTINVVAENEGGRSEPARINRCTSMCIKFFIASIVRCRFAVIFT